MGDGLEKQAGERIMPRLETLIRGWKWDDSGIILVSTLKRVKYDEKDKVIKTIDKMIKEFGLPFKVKECPPESEKEIESIVLDCHRGNPICFNFKKVLRALNKIQGDSKRLLQAFVIIIDKGIYKYIQTDDHNKPDIYGAADMQGSGLVVLIDTRDEVVRHEVGHIFELDHHAEGRKGVNLTCIMNYDCSYTHTQFCDKCKQEIEIFGKRN